MTPAELAEWIRVAPWLAALLIVLIVIGVVLRWVITTGAPALKKLTDMADDFLGEPSRPGVDARPGVMERLKAAEVAQVTAAREQAAIAREQTAIAEKLEVVRHEMFPNSGASLRDAVDNQGRAIARIDEKLAADYERIEAVEETVAEIVDTRMTEAIETIKENP